MPYAIVDGRTGKAVPEAEFWQQLSQNRLVCIGESHTNPHHHWVQLTVLQRLLQDPQWKQGSAVGLEMVQTPFQAVLDDYAQGKIDEAAMLSRTGWNERWAYDFALYRAQLEAVRRANGTLLALNAPKELTKKVVRQGLEALTVEERAQLPSIDLENTAHKRWFVALMGELGDAHPPTGPSKAPPSGQPQAAPASPEAGGGTPAPAAKLPSMDRIYTVQVIWDETMAYVAERWLAAEAGRHVAILAGSGHCHDLAIVGRAKARADLSAVSILPIVDKGEGEVASAVAAPLHDYLFVLQPPAARLPPHANRDQVGK